MLTVNPETNKVIDGYFGELKSNGIRKGKLFNIASPQETKLREAIKESDAFLKLISFDLKQQIKGQTIDVGTGNLLTGRKSNGRFRREVGVTGTVYEMAKQDSNAFVPYELLTEWANAGKNGEFMKLLNASVSKQFALDVLRIGFHGVTIAADTDPVKCPNGEDVNKGWLTVMKEQFPDQVLPSVVLDATGQTEGAYKNLDSIVKSMIHDIIEDPHQEDGDLVVLVARDLVSAEQSRLSDAATTPTEHAAAQKLDKSIGGLPSFIPPYFKSGQIWVTSLKNLHAMAQSGTQYRKVAQWEEDEAGIESSWLRMAAYGVDNHKKFAAIEAVTSPTPAQ
ncbi:phage major capsid protein, P2 family [Enterovibrio norvegicus]|uniref:phage major capsid protein, P2 family n=1 Tax=Enterovibrio norvegicus TaxID=188144 RepID=UPI000C85E2A5|nr:phage major capsid protein, P2 family [Enterovibrio norvegicus]PMN68404.1 phage major capsid protein, P2 family [Enterovibrio norvegicus]